MEIVCRHCGLCQNLLTAKIEKHYIPNGGYHIKALCSNCGRFIRNIPHSSPKIIPFGKYKGMLIADVVKENPAYLRWLCGRNITTSLRKSIQRELEKVEDVDTQTWKELTNTKSDNKEEKWQDLKSKL
ncbi:MAG: hypothetical protein DDT22_01223 [candidate division WS2 bacterium]|nr:hypothetical protein [Candidatus Lithacetigena glycinireducens]